MEDYCMLPMDRFIRSLFLAAAIIAPALGCGRNTAEALKQHEGLPVCVKGKLGPDGKTIHFK